MPNPTPTDLAMVIVKALITKPCGPPNAIAEICGWTVMGDRVDEFRRREYRGATAGKMHERVQNHAASIIEPHIAQLQEIAEIAEHKNVVLKAQNKRLRADAEKTELIYDVILCKRHDALDKNKRLRAVVEAAKDVDSSRSNKLTLRARLYELRLALDALEAGDG